MRETAGPASSEQLEIKDARLIFDAVWEQLGAEVGHEGLRFPKEIILLGGAPGAGKGTNTRFIMNARGFTCPPIVISDLLMTPEMEAAKNRGEMVGDREVISILLRTLLRPEFRDGAILDGFPRTMVQVECLKLLVAKINDLHREFRDTPLASQRSAGKDRLFPSARQIPIQRLHDTATAYLKRRPGMRLSLSERVFSTILSMRRAPSKRLRKTS